MPATNRQNNKLPRNLLLEVPGSLNFLRFNADILVKIEMRLSFSLNRKIVFVGHEVEKPWRVPVVFDLKIAEQSLAVLVEMNGSWALFRAKECAYKQAQDNTSRLSIARKAACQLMSGNI